MNYFFLSERVGRCGYDPLLQMLRSIKWTVPCIVHQFVAFGARSWLRETKLLHIKRIYFSFAEHDGHGIDRPRNEEHDLFNW